jgi:signal transduction histidine kinase
MLKKKDANDLQNFDLNDAIDDTLRIIAPEVIKRGVALNTNYAKRPLSVQADKTQLQQVILNLALNGMDAMHDNIAGTEKISIETARNGGSEVEVSVSDSGTGIALDRLKKIFDTFYTTKQDGTGLGLSISRTIIENYGGKIWAENRSEGGAVIRFTLPLSNKPTP